MNTTPTAPTYLQKRHQMIDGIATEYREAPCNEVQAVEYFSQIAFLVSMDKASTISPTEYLRRVICGLTQAGAPRKIISAVSAYYMSVIREDE